MSFVGRPTVMFVSLLIQSPYFASSYIAAAMISAFCSTRSISMYSVRLVLAHLIAGEDRAECDKVRHGLGVGAAADALQLSLLAGLLLIYLGQSADEFTFGGM